MQSNSAYDVAVFTRIGPLNSDGADVVKHALVIEDNHLIAMMIKEELADRGYGLIENATSQREAIEMAMAR